MSNNKLKIHNTNLNNLISNLRGEIGEIISSWVLMCGFKVQAEQLQTDDITKDRENTQLNLLPILIDKLSDEIIARLSELSEQRVGQITFYFVKEKIGQFEKEISDFKSFIKDNKFTEKRNKMISHKWLPEKWSDHRDIHIPYAVVSKGVAMALQLMKKIDRIILGPSSYYLWLEMLKRRYDFIINPKSAYILLPYLRLSKKQRAEIIFQEISEGKKIWTDTKMEINGIEVPIRICKDWGAVLFIDKTIMLLDNYPLQSISSITTSL